MGSLVDPMSSSGIAFNASRALAVVLAMPLFAIVLAETYPYISGMSPAKAVVFFSVVGGASGVISQAIAAEQLDRLYRQVNAVELVPAILASILASGVATYALLPPNPNPVTQYLRQTNNLPN